MMDLGFQDGLEFAKKREEIFRRLHAATAVPKGELEYSTPFQLLVAVVLSAQATDKGVNRATRALFRDHPTPQAIARSNWPAARPWAWACPWACA